MKRILIALALIIFIIMLPETVKADEINGITYEYVFTTTNASSYINEELKIYSHYPFAFVRENPNGSRLHLVTVVDVENQYYIGKGLANLSAVRNTTEGTASIVWNNDGETNYNQTIPVTKASGGSPTYNWSIMLDPAPYTDVQIFDTYSDAFAELSYVEPTFYYDASIPTPKLEVWTTNVPLMLYDYDTEQTFVECKIQDNDDFYVQVQHRVKCPIEIGIGLKRGEIYYEIQQWDASTLRNTIPITSLTVCDDIVLSGVENFYWQKPASVTYRNLGLPSWVDYDGVAVEGTPYYNAIQEWENRCSWVCPFYGNEMTIYARLYLKDGDDYYVGPWRVWQSTYPDTFTTEIPGNYETGYHTPGLTTQVNNPDGNVTTTDLTTGDVTGSQNINVTVNSNVPNYPDYPTAVSYNHDNLLVKWITTTQQLPDMFGQFSAFLATAFTFIRSDFWVIVNFGLLCCIGIMIIKIL